MSSGIKGVVSYEGTPVFVIIIVDPHQAEK
jgi:hypothetical protein